MRLYLSSYRIGDSADRLVALIDGRNRACVIRNALDHISNEARQENIATAYDPIGEFAALGIDAENLDLRKYFGDRNGLGRALRQYGLVWVLGGNSFLLMRAMVQSGFYEIIRLMLAEDAIAYGGFSAGAVVATPTLRGIDIIDDPTELADGYTEAVVWDGLGLVDFSIVPHFRSDHPEAPLAEKAVKYLTENDLPFKALRDGDVLIKSGEDIVLRPRNPFPRS